MPTEACNFRCVYCYEEFHYRRMEAWVVQGLKNFIARRAAGLRELTLSWFGGEPLLAKDIIEDVLLDTRKVLNQHPRIRFISDITTNAYLLSRPVFQRLLDLGVTRYQISFDGPREWHDRKRVLAGGRGTFDRIWGNVAGMRDVAGDFQVVVRLHADKENREALPEFMDAFQREFGGDPRFDLFIRTLARWGGPNDDRLDVFGREEADEAIQAIRALAAQRGIRQHAPSHEGYVCYAARANSFLVRANGRLNKCTLALEHPNNQVGMLHEDGTVELAASKMAEWTRGLFSGKAEEQQCPMRGYADPVPNATPSLEAPLGRRAPIRVPLELVSAPRG